MTALVNLPSYEDLERARVEDLIARVIRPHRLPICAYLYGTARTVARVAGVDIGTPDDWKPFYNAAKQNLKRGDA